MIIVHIGLREKFDGQEHLYRLTWERGEGAHTLKETTKRLKDLGVEVALAIPGHKFWLLVPIQFGPSQFD